MSQPQISAELEAANRRLHARRLSLQKAPSSPPTPNSTSSDPFPRHLGWGSQMLSKFISLEGEGTRGTDLPPFEFELLPKEESCEIKCEDSGRTIGAAFNEKTVKLYPSIGLALLKQQRSAEGRIWLLCRHLDEAGRGWLPVDLLKQELATKGAPLKACGWRQLRKLLQRGMGDFWQRDDAGRLWLRSAAHVAACLGVEKMAGRPIWLPVRHLCNIQSARAHFYASFFSGRKTENPITRAQLAVVTGVRERTQPFYEKIAGVCVQRCIAVGEEFTKETLKEALWQRRGNAFVFCDVNGEQGKPGRKYIGWHLPSRYSAQHRPARFGRQRKIHKQLRSSNTLVDSRARGNAAVSITDLGISKTRVFYESGKLAVRAKSKRERDEVYWPRWQRGCSAELWLTV